MKRRSCKLWDYVTKTGCMIGLECKKPCENYMHRSRNKKYKRNKKKSCKINCIHKECFAEGRKIVYTCKKENFDSIGRCRRYCRFKSAPLV